MRVGGAQHAAFGGKGPIIARGSKKKFLVQFELRSTHQWGLDQKEGTGGLVFPGLPWDHCWWGCSTFRCAPQAHPLPLLPWLCKITKKTYCFSTFFFAQLNCKLYQKRGKEGSIVPLRSHWWHISYTKKNVSNMIFFEFENYVSASKSYDIYAHKTATALVCFWVKILLEFM